MAIRQRLDDDLKAALLAGDTVRVDTIRGLKSTILYADVASKKRASGGVSDEEVMELFAKEAKKRQESADLYLKAAAQERADRELFEKGIIEGYLPTQVSDDELRRLIDEIITQESAQGIQAMGTVIGLVKSKAGATAGGARIARFVKERLGVQ